MPLTPADVRNKQFSTTRLRPGYDEEEVDGFLDEVEAELDRLIQENQELRAKLAEALRGGPRQNMPAMASPLSGPVPDLALPLPAPPVLSEQERRPAPAATGMAAGRNDDFGSVARVLSVAQQIGDQAIAEARRESDETLKRARREADEVLTNARRQAKQITDDARTRAEALDRDAQERHSQALGSLLQQREELERSVDDLRAFEHEHRSRLKAYLETRLRDLDAGVSSGDELPAAFQGPGQPGAPARMPGNWQP
jgi:DivIVA domain-containing protein